MASSSYQSLFVVILFLSITTINARHIHIIGHLSNHPLCQKVHYPKLCEAVASTGSFNSAHDLTIAAIKYTMDKIRSGISTVENLRANAGSDQVRQSYFDVCKDHFTDSLTNLQTALVQLTGAGTDMGVVKSELSGGITNTGLCNSDWKESGLFSDFPLERITTNLYKLASNAYTLGDGLKGAN